MLDMNTNSQCQKYANKNNSQPICKQINSWVTRQLGYSLNSKMGKLCH